jgi:hypothetical protein
MSTHELVKRGLLFPPSSKQTTKTDRQILFIQHEREESERGYYKENKSFVKKVVFVVVNKTN